MFKKKNKEPFARPAEEVEPKYSSILFYKGSRWKVEVTEISTGRTMVKGFYHNEEYKAKQFANSRSAIGKVFREKELQELLAERMKQVRRFEV